MSKTNDLQAMSLRFTIKQGLDEDAGYVLEADRLSLLAAFDGMGGMGSRRFQSLQNRTSAYLASHFYAHLLEKDFSACLHAGCFDRPFDYSTHLKQLFSEEASRAKAQYLDREPSSIIGSLARTLPSTAAIAVVNKVRHSCLYIWAGDSRGYFMTDYGLYQITKDHTKRPLDAFDSLYQDAPMSNYINADQPFELAARHIIMKRPGLVIVATDGAFGCLPTPMHFEGILLNALATSNNMEQWLENIKAALHPHANDDVTLAMYPLGFDSFSHMQHAFFPRLKHIEQHYIQPSQGLVGQDTEGLKALWRQYDKEMRSV